MSLIEPKSIKKNCIVIGNTGLCQQAISILLENNWNIKSVFSDDIKVLNFCKNNNILHNKLTDVLTFSDCNYVLFSIANPIILTNDFFDKNQNVMAINYHDSLLPKYAGTNSTSWAIIEGETVHGVTWHLINNKVDFGDIILQESISLCKDETVATLNLKCFTAAIALFKKLLIQIEFNSLSYIPQEISARSFYPKHKLPNNFGFLNQERNDECMDKILRGLSFGELYNNILATAKIYTNDSAYIVTDIDYSNAGPSYSVKKITGEDIKQNVIFNRAVCDFVLNDSEMRLIQSIRKKETRFLDELHSKFQDSPNNIFNKHERIAKSVKIYSNLTDLQILHCVQILLLNVTNNNMYVPVIRYYDHARLKSFVHKISWLSTNTPDGNRTLAESLEVLEKSWLNPSVFLADIFYRYRFYNIFNDAVVLVMKDEINGKNKFESLYDSGLKFIIKNNGVEFVCYGEDEYIAGVVRCFKYLLEKYSNLNFEHQVKQLCLLSNEDYHSIVNIRNRTLYPINLEENIYSLFEKQAKRTPNNVAIIYMGNAVTYQQLIARVESLYFHSLENYKSQNILIPIYLSRTPNLLIAILTILKSGNAYVPLNVDDPRKRIESILTDTNAGLVLTDQENQEKISDICQCCGKNIEIKLVDMAISEFNEALLNDSNVPKVNINGNDLAYVMYTSGTTGKPKGVMIQHKGIVNRIQWMNFKFPLAEDDRVLHKTPCTFDVSGWELFWPIWYGASIVIAEQNMHRDGECLIELMKQQNVSVVHFVPSMLNIFYYLKDVILPSLRYIFTSGEKLEKKQADHVKQLFPDAKLINLYGPTEASIDVTYFDCNQNLSKIYIGRPINNTACYVLNRFKKPVQDGIPGELYISGIGLAKGYLNLPEVTERMFQENNVALYSEERSSFFSRIYRSGDLVRWDKKSELEYIKRIDSQVKLNGVRIELQEISNSLSLYPGIMQVELQLRERDGKKLLIAFYSSENEINERLLMAHISKFLPETMCPNCFKWLPTMPTTINGKLDINALHGIAISHTQEKGEVLNSVEFKIRTIIGIVLNIPEDSIGISEDFFALGGDSILALKLVIDINELFDSAIKVVDVFASRTIKSLAAKVSLSLGDSKKEVNKNKFMVQDELISYPCSMLQSGMIMESLTFKKGMYHDVFLYPVNKEFDERLCTDVWVKLSNKHELLRTSFHLTKNGYENKIHKCVSPKLSIYNNLSSPGLIQDEAEHDFEINCPGLYRVIVNFNEKNFDLIFSFHHAIADGWSVSILISDFLNMYIKGESVNHSEIFSYSEYIKQEQAAVENKSLYKFWRRYLDDVQELNIQWDKKSSNFELGLIKQGYKVDELKSHRLSKLAKEYKVRVSSLFLLAFIKSLVKYSGQCHALVGLIVNNRLEVKGGDTKFGLFLNTLPLWINFNNLERIENQLNKLVRYRTCLQKYKSLPFAKIKPFLKKQRLQYVFNFINFHHLTGLVERLGDFAYFEKTNIPFVFNVYQGESGTYTFTLTCHSDFISKDDMKRFSVELKMTLDEICS